MLARGCLGEPAQRAAEVVADPGARVRERRHVDDDAHGADLRHLDFPAVTLYADLFRYGDLFLNLFRRELRVKYRGSVLGLGWTLCFRSR